METGMRSANTHRELGVDGGRLLLVLIALAALASLRELAPPRLGGTLRLEYSVSPGAKFAWLEPWLAGQARVGYMDDPALSQAVRGADPFQANYALAPVVVSRDHSGPLVLLNFLDDATAQRACEQAGLEPVVIRNGVGLATAGAALQPASVGR